MHTLLSRFCEEFVRIVDPLVAPLGRVADAISAAPEETSGIKIHAQLLDLRQQLELLGNKVAEQQAYVLIFGPLKSGKSTLMNAISSSYVSEVSSLPAYPCMVFLSHGPKRDYTVTDYRGKSQEFQDPNALQKHVDAAHTQLAGRIRDAESKGGQFDPQKQFTDAIRRIDVHLPTEALGQSKAVLVDTPGLYSRMKFGYDQMTRDFRNAAACAVFVVRSDNLFLEQVFAEFNQLLELFSRIFLVVNIDSTKHDLGSDGKLVPSLEQSDPQRIITAFENLSMSAPLQKASEAGRLRIYPVDLLRSASSRLQAKDDGAAKPAAAKPAAAQPGNAKPKEPVTSGFDRFFGDLTEYLNSTDYLVAFLGDSMRRAKALLGESRTLCDHGEVKKLEAALGENERDRRRESARVAALKRLQEYGWKDEFGRLERDLDPVFERLSQDIGARTLQAVSERLGHWFRSRDSLQKLVKGDLVPLFTSYQEELTAAVSRALGERVLEGQAGIRLPDEITAALRLVGLDLADMGRQAMSKTDRGALIAVPPTPLRPEQITVRRTFWDWLTFRRPGMVRRRLFGPNDNPDQAIPMEQKTSRLGDAGKAEMRRLLRHYEEKFFVETAERVRAGFLGGYGQAVIDELMRGLRGRRAQVTTKMTALQKQERDYLALLEPMRELKGQTETSSTALEGLSQHYGDVDLFLLTKPLKGAVKIPAQPPQGQNKPTSGKVDPRTLKQPGS